MKLLKYILFCTLTLLAGTVLAQDRTQTIRGQVVDADTRQPLGGATVILRDAEVLDGQLTDKDGVFRFSDIPVGRVTLQVKMPGYAPAVLAELPLQSGKEMVLTVELTESLAATAADGEMETELAEVTITDEKAGNEAQNEMATLSARSFSVEETRRYAASVFDPARMAQNYAGVMSSGFDMENEIVIRGNSPRYMLWRLEGIEIPNPNHFGSMGSSGGPISMLSASTLANSDFYTGAFPAEFGNALSGVFDLRFRRGNNEKRESSFMVGVLGIEASTEGYFSKKSKASYLVNYRYSTLALMQTFVPSLDGVLPKYQDASFNIFLPTKIGNFSIFGLGGSNVATQDAVADSTQWEDDGDGVSFIARQQVGVAGVKHQALLGEKTFVRTVAAVSADNYMDESYRLLKEQDYQRDVFDVTDFDNYSYRIHSMLQHKPNAQHTFRTGVLASHLQFNYKYDQKDFWDENVWTRYLDTKGSTQLLQGYGQWKYRFHEDWTLNAGLHGTFLTFNDTWAVDPRLALTWQAAPRHRLALSAGMHSKPEHISTLMVEQTDLDGQRTLRNRNLDMTHALHLVAGHDFALAKNLRLKVEAYYQYLWDIPISKDSGSVESIVNIASIWDVIDVNQYASEGTGYNYGLDLTLEKTFSNNYYFMLTGSVFDSRYVDQFGETHSTRFNNNYTANLLGGKEFKVGKSKKNILGLNGKLLLSGGNRFTPIDVAASQADEGTVRIWERAYESRVPDYFRFDFGVSYTINTKKATHTIMLDIQNATNRQNVFSQYYDSDDNALRYVYQNGIFPLFNYRVEF